MKPFSLEWIEEADDALALIWMDHPEDSDAINLAQVSIDKLLTSNPVKYGEHRSEGL